MCSGFFPRVLNLCTSSPPPPPPPPLSLGHDHIDILKIDIEGWEFNALSAFFQPYSLPASKAHPMPPRPLPIGQMQLELHLWNTSFPALLKWWETLEDVGLRPFWAEPNLVYQNYHPDRHSELAEVRSSCMLFFYYHY